MKQTKYIPELGKEYGTWTVISKEIKKGNFQGKSSDRSTYWKVKCECGREAWRNASILVAGKIGKTCKSCAKQNLYKSSFLAQYFNRIKTRAKRSNFEIDITIEYIIDLFNTQNKKCALSDLEISFRDVWHGNITQTASLDRIDNSKGYVKGNVQWVHKDVNFMKGTLSQEKFMELCKLITSKCG